MRDRTETAASKVAALYRASMAAVGLDDGDFIEYTPTVANCDDWGTG